MAADKWFKSVVFAVCVFMAGVAVVGSLLSLASREYVLAVLWLFLAGLNVWSVRKMSR